MGRSKGRAVRVVVVAAVTTLCAVTAGSTAVQAATETRTFVAAGSTWRYLTTGTPPANWNQPAFDDAGWASGRAQLGFGDGDEVTRLPGWTATHLVDHFRQRFTVTGAVQSVSLRLLADDGALVYLNGQLVVRDNVQTAGRYAAAGRSGVDENAWRTFTIPAAALVAGTNTLAVSVHQDWTGSSDVSFDLSLTAVVDVPTTTTSTTTTLPTTTTSTATTSTTAPTTTTTTSAPTTTTTSPPTTAPRTFVPAASTWRYLATGAAPSGWQLAGFADSAWATGRAQLGFGDGDEATVIPGWTAGHLVDNFRTTFTSDTTVQSLTVRLLADDGARVYLNGVLVVDDNVHSNGRWAASSRSGTAETAWRTFAVPASMLALGTNVLAVSVHQDGTSSSDVSFDLELTGVPGTPPPPPPPPPGTLLAFGAPWRYLATGVAPAATWTQPSFDDAAWTPGFGQLGNGDGDETTLINRTTPAHVVDWFRTRFTVADLAAVTAPTLDLLADDGAIVYVNGQQVVRDNVQAAGTYAVAGRSEPAEMAVRRFAIPRSVLVAGTNTIAVSVHQDSSTSTDVSFDLRLLTAPAPTAVPAPPATNVMYAVGDIGMCTRTVDDQVGDLLDTRPEGIFAVLGDVAYPGSGTADIQNCYDPNFGANRGRTYPAIGNHEYLAPGARPYFDYFGARAGPFPDGWYSYDLNGWHVVVLNSNCIDNGCAPGTPQYDWLQADLAAHPTPCSAAYWHHPLRSSETGFRGATNLGAFVSLLDASGVDVVLNGHAHTYERFAPQNATGSADPNGFRTFVVGTGGAEDRTFATPDALSQARSTNHGMLRLQLDPGAYSWEFVGLAGEPAFTDTGTAACT